MRTSLYIVLVWLASSVIAAPELSENDRFRLEDRTTDRDINLDEQDGFYVLLRNAATWQADDFSGDAGAAVAPPPDYGFLKEKPAEARGNIYLVEGWLAYQDRWPTLVNHSSDKLAVNTTWGEQVTRWTIVTEKDNPDATVIVLFYDPNGKMIVPETGSRVRVAARFHKLWSIPSSNRTTFNYPTFVGGAAEIVNEPPAATASGGATSSLTIVLAAIVIVGGFFVVMRILMKKVAAGGGGGTQLRDRLEEMRREREATELRDEDPEAEDIDDLPDDPIEALGALQQRHERHR